MELQISYGIWACSSYCAYEEFYGLWYCKKKKAQQARLINYFVALFIAWQQSKCGGFGGKFPLRL